MHLNSVKIKNFRLLKDVELSLEKDTTVIVGRNNAGKTSFTELFRRLLETKPKFNLEDFSISLYEDFWNAFILSKDENKTEGDVRAALPQIEVMLSFNYDITAIDLGSLSEFLIDLDPSSNKVIVNIQFRLKNGSVEPFFKDLVYSSNPAVEEQEKRNFFRVIKSRLSQYYSTYLVAVDPTNASNIKELDFSKFQLLLQTGFINAQRGLDDVTHKENEVLGKLVERMLTIAKSEPSSPDHSIASNLESAVQGIQAQLDTDFKVELDKLIPALSDFGYPGLGDIPLHTETILDVERLLENHTKVRYAGENGINLPESYNGLGSRNLIFILFKIYEFFKSYQSKSIAPGMHLVFIEEPEAHLHPQMQEVFIRKVTEIAKKFSDDTGIPWPIQFIITTHSTHIANEASFEKIRYFMSSKSSGSQTRVKDLRNGLTETTFTNEDKEFLHKYLTLTKCDLFFADKAILIEGATERILMPKIIKIVDEASQFNPLSSKYLSVVEVGGAYAHHFYNFLNFLELRTLIVTDIDSVNATREKCPVADGVRTSNTGIRKWFSDDHISPADLLQKSNDDKIKDCLRIAYQVPEDTASAVHREVLAGMQQSAASTDVTSLPAPSVETANIPNTQGPCGRSFEDAFIIANPSLFGITGSNVAQQAWEEAKRHGKRKADFAIELAMSPGDWNVPKYIKEGLAWLAENPAVEANAQEETQDERAN